MSKDWTVEQDLTRNAFQDVAINLFDLYRARIQMGQRAIENITFRDCLIEGPAVMLAVSGVHFDAVNFNSSGDMRNLILRPESTKSVIGAIPVLNCSFIGTTFFGVGFTGPKPFLDQLLTVGSPQ